MSVIADVYIFDIEFVGTFSKHLAPMVH